MKIIHIKTRMRGRVLPARIITDLIYVAWEGLGSSYVSRTEVVTW